MLIGLFGGSFNPVHHGHLIVARSVAEQLGLSRMILIPAAVPPHKPVANLAPAADRLEMLRLAVRGEGLFELSDAELRRPGPSYTVTTVEQFGRDLGPAAELHWLIGADSLGELVNWYQARRLIGLCRIVTAARPGWEQPDLGELRERFGPEQVERLAAGILPTPRIDISASEIRRRIRQGQSIRYLAPEPVVDYIESRRLYRAE